MEDRVLEPVVETTEVTEKKDSKPRVSVKELKALIEHLNKENLELQEKLKKSEEYNAKIYDEANAQTNKFNKVLVALNQVNDSLGIVKMALKQIDTQMNAIANIVK